MQSIAVSFIVLVGIIMMVSSLFTGRVRFSFTGLIVLLIGGVWLISILPDVAAWAASLLRIVLLIGGACVAIYIIIRVIQRLRY